MAKYKQPIKPQAKPSTASSAATKQPKVKAISFSAKWDELSSGAKIKMFWGVGVSVLLFFFFWFKPIEPSIIDPWFRGAVLIDSGMKVQDPAQRLAVINRGGAILREQVKRHPYHARVHYLFGYYYYAKADFDSCILEEKKAIDIGAGGIVNQIEYPAAELLNSALGNKLNTLLANPASAMTYIDQAVSPKFYNFTIDKFKAIVYGRLQRYDSCEVATKRYLRFAPNDYDALYNLAVSYAMSQKRDSAIKYASIASQVNPQNPSAQNLINQLNGR